jgi:hypothetical protein
MMPTTRILTLLAGSILLLTSTAACLAADAPAAAAADKAALLPLVRTRDSFLRRASEEGYASCPGPGIELGLPPGLARFRPESNTVVVATWSRLEPEQRERYEHLAQGLGDSQSAQAMFEDGTQRWLLVHELGHWWQTCRQQVRRASYGAEDGANRIALAFWREQDPALAKRMLATFRYLAGSIPDPVPSGASKPDYFDQNFMTLLQGRGYLWYQADMTLGLAAELPAPSLHKALSQPLYPW